MSDLKQLRRRLFNIKVDHVSLVDRAANGRQFLLFKRENGGEMEELKKVLLEIQTSFNAMVAKMASLDNISKRLETIEKNLKDGSELVEMKKIGAKLSAANKARLKQMQSAMAAILADGGGDDEPEDQKKNLTDEGDPMDAFTKALAGGEKKKTPEMAEMIKSMAEMFRPFLEQNKA